MDQVEGLDAEIDLHTLWRSLKRRKWTAIAIFTACVLVNWFRDRRLTPLYETQLTLKYSKNYVAGMESILERFDIPSYNTMETEAKFLRLAELAMAVADRLKWTPQNVQGSYSIQVIKDSYLINVIARARTPYDSVRLANAIAAVASEKSVENKRLDLQMSLRDLEARKKNANKTLIELEHRRRHFLETHYNTGQGAQMSGQLLELNAQREELLKRYTVKHPNIIRLDARIRSLRQRLAKIPAQDAELDQMTRDIKVQEELYTQLSSKGEEVRIALNSIPPTFTVVSKPELPSAPAYPNTRRDMMLACSVGIILGFGAVWILEGLDRSMTQIHEVEGWLNIPVVAVVPTIQVQGWTLWEKIRPGKSEEKNENYLLPFLTANQSHYVEIYHSMRNSLHALLGRPQNMLLSFASAEINEGKTITAVNFCLAASQAGLKTLLIDADLRRGSISSLLGIPKEPGLVQVLGGELPWWKAARSTADFLTGKKFLEQFVSFPGVDNLRVIPGWAASHVVNTLSSPRLPGLLDELRSHFQVVVLDSTPTLLFIDTLITAPHTDGTVLVYRAGKTLRSSLKRAKIRLEEAKSKVLGVVINNLSEHLFEDYNYRYASRYYSSGAQE